MPDQLPPQASDGSGPDDAQLPEPSETDELIHSLGTPLTVISGYVQLLRRRNRSADGSRDAALERSLLAIEGAVEKMKDIVVEHRNGPGNSNSEPDPDR